MAKETAEKAKPPTPTSPKPPKVKSEVAIERSKSKDAEEGKTDTSMKRKSPDTVSSSNAKGIEPVKPDKSKGDTSQVKKAKKGSTAEIKPSVDMGKPKGKKKQKTGKDAEKEKKASKGINEKKDDDEEAPFVEPYPLLHEVAPVFFLVRPVWGSVFALGPLQQLACTPLV